MAKRKQMTELKSMKPSDLIRQGWLAYLGVYGVAFERAKPALNKLTKKYAGLFGELVEKGAEIEVTAKEQIVDVRDRANGVYAAGLEKVRGILPVQAAANDRVKELEAEVAALTKKLGAPVKKAAKRAVKRAKAA